MHRPDSAFAPLAEDKGSFISEDNAMTVVDDLEKCTPHDPSRQAGPSLDTALPTFERESEAFYGPPGKRDVESASILGSNAKEATNEIANVATTPTTPTDAASYDFPDGGARAWSVAIGVSEHSHSSPLLRLFSIARLHLALGELTSRFLVFIRLVC